MRIDYIYSSWVEEFRPSGEVKVIFNGRGYLRGTGDSTYLFSAPIKPFYMAVHGEWVRGVFYERGEVNRFSVIPCERGEGDKVRVRLVVRGVFKEGVLKDGVYTVPVDWRGRHKHVITIVGAVKVGGVRPQGALVSRHRAGFTLSWLWREGYKGLVSLKFTK